MLDQAEVAHHLAPKARVEKMKNGVLDAADVLVDGKPVIDLRRIEGSLVVVGVAVAVEIPGRIHECVHCVGLATRWPAAFRAKSYSQIPASTPAANRPLLSISRLGEESPVDRYQARLRSHP